MPRKQESAGKSQPCILDKFKRGRGVPVKVNAEEAVECQEGGLGEEGSCDEYMSMGVSEVVESMKCNNTGSAQADVCDEVPVDFN